MRLSAEIMRAHKWDLSWHTELGSAVTSVHSSLNMPLGVLVTGIFYFHCRKLDYFGKTKAGLKFVCIVGNSDNQLSHIRLSLCSVVCPSGRICIKFGVGDFYEKLSLKLKLVQIGQKYRRIYLKRSKYVLLLPETRIGHRLFFTHVSFILLTVPRTPAIQTKNTVLFLW
jgi:hypothetical protein